MRPAKARTPANQAAYHTWALVMDVALLPLYIYLLLASYNNYGLPPNKVAASGQQIGDRWTSFFGVPSTTSTLMIVTYAGAAALAGLHLISCAFDLALIILFRKISALPPDMNPLEDNLTSRGPRVGGNSKNKHKYKTSEITLASESCLTDAEKKRMAHISGSTLNLPDPRLSRTSLANKSTVSVDDHRSVPFTHSRNDSAQTYSPHNPESARWSKHQFEGQQGVYQEAATNPRRSRYEIRADGKLEVRSRGGSQSPTKRGSFAAPEPALEVVTLDVTAPTPTKEEAGRPFSPPLSSYLRTEKALPVVPNAAQSNAVAQMEQEQSLLKQGNNNNNSSSNWYVLDDEDEPQRERTPAPEFKHLSTARPLSQEDRHDSFQPTGPFHPKPLGMNPPTPPMDQQYQQDQQQKYESETGVNRTLTAASTQTASSSVYSESAPSLTTTTTSLQRAGTPKGKYYGDLAAATRGVRQNGAGGLPPSPQSSPERRARVISRTGVDVGGEYQGAGIMYGWGSEGRFGGGARRREVSGKAVEEGRGGVWNGVGERVAAGRMRKGEWVD